MTHVSAMHLTFPVTLTLAPWLKVILTCMPQVSYPYCWQCPRNQQKFNSTFWIDPVTLVKVMVTCILLKVLSHTTFWSRFHNSTDNSVREIDKSSKFQHFMLTPWPWPWVKVMVTCILSKVLSHTTFWSRFHNSTVNSVREIDKSSKFQHLKLTPWPAFKGLAKYYLWVEFHDSTVNSVRDIVHV